MDKTQQIILDIYKEYKRICEENGLRYFANGGTVLGAVRHGGFIPWDDDMDVTMAPDDYFRFRTVAKESLNEPYAFLDYTTNIEYARPFPRIENVNTTFIEEMNISSPGRYKGIHLDIMPVAGITKDPGKAAKFLKRLNIIQGLDYAQRRVYNKWEDVKTSKLIWLMLHPFLCLWPKGYFIRKWEKMLYTYEISPENDVCFPHREADMGRRRGYVYKRVFPYEYFREVKPLPFEDTEMYIPVEEKRYLEDEYGPDYMTPPPPEKRGSVHGVVVLDTERSYKSYTLEEVLAIAKRKDAKRKDAEQKEI